MICGIDEAGRGPVIGPMVVAGVLVDEDSIKRLEAIGVKDSKLLSPEKREKLFDMIKGIVKGYEIVVVSPKQIDDSLDSETLNLNKLEAITAAKILNVLRPKKAIIDAPSNNIPAFVEYLEQFIEVKIDIVAEHKADLNHVEVGAASILAKVTRDREICKIEKKYDIKVGSGYPSDPKTVKFLEENYDKYDFFRKSWASYKKINKALSQKRLGDY